MSTAVALQNPPSHSSPLRPRDPDMNSVTTSPRSGPNVNSSKRVSGQRRRSMSSSSSRGVGNANRSPSFEERTGAHRSALQSSQNRPSPRAGDAQNSGEVNPAPKDPAQLPVIKKEGGSSPETHPTSNPSVRRRPRNLDLSQPTSAGLRGGAGGGPSAPLTSKDSAGLSAMQDVGLACLSPGFQTQDPSMQHQLARSMEMRERQRRIIEQRLLGRHGNDIGPGDANPPSSAFGNAPGSSKRKGPPPGLSINAPSAHHFATEPRVIQSAPLNQSFTGLKPSGSHVHPLSRQVLERHPQPNSGSHMSGPNGSGMQSGNRLPPISDVLSNEGFGGRHADSMGKNNSGFHAPHSTYSPHATQTNHGPLPSPGYPPPPAPAGLTVPHRTHPTSQHMNENSSSIARPREFKSAEEAVQTLSGGREDLLPKIVHYNGRLPPTPSTQQGPTALRAEAEPRSGSGRRRTREEYERDVAEGDRMDVDGHERGRDGARRGYAWDDERNRRFAGSFSGSSDSPETNRRKKEEFMGLCARAWDLFHS